LNPVAWLLDASPFLTRDHCGVGWSSMLQVAYIASNVTIAVAYFVIPVEFAVLYRSKRQELPQPQILLLLIGFILFCGLTHLADVLIFWWAPYRLYTLVCLITGVLSIGTAAYLPVAIRRIILMPTREFVHKINDQLHVETLRAAVENAKRQELVKTLEAHNQELTRIIRNELWKTQTETTIQALRQASARLKEELANVDS
jgi:chemotaxis family two-component system sensor kinase Cph1